MIEGFVLGLVQKVLGDYLTNVLTKRQGQRSRAELVGLIESQVQATQAIDAKVEAMSLAVRELDVIVKLDRGLSWQDDQLVVRPSGRLRKAPPSPQEALEQLVESVTARRRELGIPLPEGGQVSVRQAEEKAERAEGDLIAPDASTKAVAAMDLRAEVLGLPTEVIREKDRRRRAAEGD